MDLWQCKKSRITITQDLVFVCLFHCLVHIFSSCLKFISVLLLHIFQYVRLFPCFQLSLCSLVHSGQLCLWAMKGLDTLRPKIDACLMCLILIRCWLWKLEILMIQWNLSCYFQTFRVDLTTEIHHDAMEFPHAMNSKSTVYHTHTVNHVDGLVQERRNSSALAMELRLSCTNPSTHWCILYMCRIMCFHSLVLIPCNCFRCY